MYSAKSIFLLQKLKDSQLVGAQGSVNLDLLGVSVDISDKSSIGSLLQEWLGKWMAYNKIYFRNSQNSQMPPDFYLSESNDKDLLEVKTFDYSKSPNFDIANFDAYVRDLRVNAYRLDADYLILGYSLESGVVMINDMWLKKVWEITCDSDKYPLRTQIKQNKIYNIRPYNFKNNSKGFKPFESRRDFVLAIKNTLAKYLNDSEEAEVWFTQVEASYTLIKKQPL